MNAVPTFEHVLHRLGDSCRARPSGVLLAHPAFQAGHQWGTEFLPDGAALRSTLAIDRSFDLEQRIDATDRLKGKRRDRCRGFALRLTTGILGEIRHDEERAAGVDPAGRFQNRSGLRSGSYNLLYPL